jgi:hypothetical protein
VLRTSILAASEPRVTRPATSHMTRKMGSMIGLLVRVIDAALEPAAAIDP